MFHVLHYLLMLLLLLDFFIIALCTVGWKNVFVFYFEFDILHVVNNAQQNCLPGKQAGSRKSWPRWSLFGGWIV